MPIVPNPVPGFQVLEAIDLIKSAMFEINVLAAGEDPDAGDAAWGLEKLQRLIDKLNAGRQAVYNVNFTLFTLTPNHAPHTIGPGGDFNVTPRPVKMVGAAFVLNAGTANPVDMPIRVVDDDWWALQPNKSLVSSITTHLFYSPDVPLGNCNFWPICNIANPVRLEMWSSLVVPVAQTTILSFPQGYWDAIVLTLAVELCSTFGIEPSPTLAERQRISERIIMANNAHPPRIRTDGGMPASNSSGRPDFNFLTGLRE